MPSTVKVVDDEAFSRNRIERLRLSEGIEDLGYYSFSNNKITEIIFPTSLKSVGAEAFYENELTSVRLGEGVLIGMDPLSESRSRSFVHRLFREGINYSDK